MSAELQHWLGRGPGTQRRLARISKHGHPFLYFQTGRALALEALHLYPAQRPAALAARTALRFVCGLGLARLLPATAFTFPEASPATTFLKSVGGVAEKIPDLAIFAGNPMAPGRRYILQLHRADGRPAAMVKVGLTEHAAALIRAEAHALESVAARTQVAPRLLATHDQGAACALAMEHIAGRTPTHATAGELGCVLTPWIDTAQTVNVSAVPAWRRLVEAGPLPPALAAARAKIEAQSFHPARYHGDFAPWNIKVQPDGSWRVLDWERGELIGLPCWDWFHYQVQVGLLVQRRPADAHARVLEGLLADPAFREYARRAGVTGVVRELLLAYLTYSMEILGPEETVPAKRKLRDLLSETWTSA